MRIAVVSPHLPTPALPMRGVRRDEQLRLFAEAGHQVQGIVPLPWAPWRDAPAEELDGPVAIAHPRYPRIPERVRRGVRLAPVVGLTVERWSFSRAALAALDRPDMVLAHSALLPGGLLGRIGPAPLVVALHDHELYELGARSVAVRRLLARTLRGAAAAVYVSEALRRRGLEIAGPHESRIIPIGIDTFDDLQAGAAEPFTICCVTRLIPRKHVDRLVRALGQLSRELPEARLRVVGDGPERGNLAALAKALGLEGRVEFLGELDRRAALQEMARASVMALPSVMESLGAVYFEAMSLGVPALGTAGEGIAAYIEHGVDGILVPAGDDERLTLELRQLALDPGRARRIGEAGRRRFLASGPTWRANAAAYLRLFDELRGGGVDRR
jgi:glycosyltransferase involved in cell wall biosynthesis